MSNESQAVAALMVRAVAKAIRYNNVRGAERREAAATLKLWQECQRTGELPPELEEHIAQVSRR